MACQVTTLRAVYFSCCLLLAAYQPLAEESLQSPQDHAIISNQIPVHHSPDHSPSSMNYHIENEKTKLPLPRNRRDLNSNRQFYNNDGNRALHSAFRYNDEIMRFLQSHSAKPISTARSEFFYNILRPLERRTARYSNWDGHSVMHFGKRSIPERSIPKRSILEDEFAKNQVSNAPEEDSYRLGVSKRSSPWSDHSVMHFGKRSDDELELNHSGKLLEAPGHETDFEEDTDQEHGHDLNYFNQRDVDKKDNDPWHSMMSFGKRDESLWADHNTMHFGKRDNDPWHSMMSFGKRDNNDPWHAVMSFGKRDGNDPWHNVMSFGKKSENLPEGIQNDEPINLETEENMKNLKETKDFPENPSSKHKRSISDEIGQDEVVPEKRYEMFTDHNTMHFGKKSDPWESHNTLHFGKKNDPWQSHIMHFGKKSDPWDSHNTMHFGKKSDPWDSHNTMHFGKKSDPWDSHNTMHFGKKSDPWDSHNTMHFGKKSDPWDSHNTMHFGKKSDPWDSHNTMHFGKKSDPWESHNTMHFGKKSDPWESHNTMHFGKKSDPWESHNTMHFGKRSEILEDNAGKKYEENPPSKTIAGKPIKLQNADGNNLNLIKRSANGINRSLVIESTDMKRHNNNKLFDTKFDNQKNSTNQNENKTTAELPVVDNRTKQTDKIADEKSTVIPITKRSVAPTEKLTENYIANPRINEENLLEEPQTDSVLHFGKRSIEDNEFENSKAMDNHWAKEEVPLTKKSENDPWETHNTMHFGKKSDPWDSHNTMHFGKKSDPWDSHSTMHFGKKSDPWDSHNTMHFGKKSDPWESHNTMHFGKKSDPWDSHNTMHFGKKSDPWGAHNTMHFGKKSDPWDSHNTMHFGKKSEPWDSHNTMHFGKKSDPWDAHNTMHFGKKSDPWNSHNTMHFGKKSDPWDSHNTMHFGKRWGNQSTVNIGFVSDFDSGNEASDLLTALPELNYLNDYDLEIQLKWKTYLSQLLVKLKEGSLTNSDVEPLKEYLLSQLLRERIFPEQTTSNEQLLDILAQLPDLDSGEGPDEAALSKILQQLTSTISTEYEPQPDDNVATGTNDDSMDENMDDEMSQTGPNLPSNYMNMQEKLPMKTVNKRYFAPFQGPRSIVYPHAWFASQIRRSVLPASSMIYGIRMAEKKEDPVNSFMHFGKR